MIKFLKGLLFENKEKPTVSTTIPDTPSIDRDEEALRGKIKDSFSAASANYFPKTTEMISFQKYAMPVHELVRAQHITAGMASIFDDAGHRKMSQAGIVLNRTIDLIEYLQNPYKDVQKARHEAAVRRNWAIQTAIAVRAYFMFTEPSHIVVELNDSQTDGLNENDKQEIIDMFKDRLRDTPYDIEKLIKLAHERDEQLKLVTCLSTVYWQVLTFGDGYILKMFKYKENELPKDAKSIDLNEVEKLYPINTRRVSELIADPHNNMSIEGAWIDGQALDKDSMIQFHYQSHQISPHTEGYGYTPVEAILNLAEGLNIFYEEDVKEIQRSAWLSSLLIQINTAGLTRSQSSSRISSLVNAIAPGKVIGVGGQGKDGIQVTPLTLNSNLTGLAEIGENQESKIYRALRVPQFLVQSEDMANRATADKSAELFLSGVIRADQKWMSDVLEAQWYEPFIRQKLDIPDDQPLPFKIRRVFDTPMVSEFIDLADGLTKLVGANIWDLEMANEKLGTPEVGDRIVNQMEQMPTEPTDSKMTFGDKDDVKDLKGNELAAAVASMQYTKGVKARATSAGLSAKVKTGKIEMLATMNHLLKEQAKKKKADKNE